MSTEAPQSQTISSNDELWGTFAVADHLRRRAFVAEAILFDRLLIPRPPKGDDEQFQEWVDNRWQPNELQEKLKRLDGLVIPIPWDQSLRERWRVQYQEFTAHQGAAFRMNLASAALFDVRNIKSQDVSTPAEYVTRSVIAMRLNGGVGGLDPVADEALYREIRDLDIDPLADIETVVGYGSYTQFHEELPMELRFREEGRTPHEPPSATNDTAFLFRWEFIVPEDSHLTDDELLDRAVRLSRNSEFRESRRQFHEWRRKLIAKQVGIETARSEMDRCLRVYNDVVDKKRTRSRAITALQVISMTLPLCDFVVPGAGAAASVAFGLGSFLADNLIPVPQATPREKIAALVHDSREAFGWSSV